MTTDKKLQNVMEKSLLIFMSILWLDDIRKPWEHGFIGVHWTKTAQEAIDFLKTGFITYASLDHDLLEIHYPWNHGPDFVCEGTGCGCDVLIWLEKNPEFWPIEGIRVHSANPEGSAKMNQRVFNNYGKIFP